VGGLIHCLRSAPTDLSCRKCSTAISRADGDHVGGFVASANRRSYSGDDFAGQSWIVSPEGDVLAETTARAPIATVTVNLAEATAARATYPRNLPEL
jgi:N-carbamoylputrescine amidase